MPKVSRVSQEFTKKNLIEVRKKGGCKEVSEEACGVVRYDDLHDVM